MPNPNDTKREIPAEVLEALKKDAGYPASDEAPEEASAPEEAPSTKTLFDDMKQVINAIQELGRQMQSTQAAVMRAQVKSTIDDDKIMALAIQIKELQMRLADAAKEKA